MLANKIIGRVAASILSQRLGDASLDEGAAQSTAMFRLDKLSSDQIAAVVWEVLGNPTLAEAVDVKIPAPLVDGQGLPPEVLTDRNAGFVRNAGTSKRALLTANGTEHELHIRILLHDQRDFANLGRKRVKTNAFRSFDRTRETTRVFRWQEPLGNVDEQADGERNHERAEHHRESAMTHHPAKGTDVTAFCLLIQPLD